MSTPKNNRRDNNKPSSRKPGGDKRSDNRNADKPYRKGPSKFNIKRSGKPSEAPKYNDSGLIRLNKFIANAGICSRREADTLIQSGIISVNGKVVTELGTRVNVTDQVKYGDQTLSHEKKRYFILNKPKGFGTRLDDPRNRKNVMELMRNTCKESILPVGRLDRESTGLLLFTNDADLSKILTHPNHRSKSIFHIHLNRNVAKEHLEAMLKGVKVGEKVYKAKDVSTVGEDFKQVGIEIESANPKVVARMFEQFGYQIKKSDRVYYAGLTKKDLPRGHSRELSDKEVLMLKSIVNQGS